MIALPPLDSLVSRLRERLRRPLPGLEAQLRMAPPVRGTDEQELRRKAAAGRRAAVLLLLYPLEDGQTGFVLTLRQRALQAHSGQVCLPGGATDENEDAVAAALREAREEVGASIQEADVLGVLTDLYIPPSDFTVTPVVASRSARPDFTRQADEVAAIIDVPVAHLLDPERRMQAKWRLHGQDVDVPYFALQGHEVWGATAMMLAEFAAILEEMVAA